MIKMDGTLIIRVSKSLHQGGALLKNELCTHAVVWWTHLNRAYYVAVPVLLAVIFQCGLSDFFYSVTFN